MKSLRVLTAAVLTAAAMSGAVAVAPQALACGAPAAGIGLSSNWKLQLPTPNSSGSPQEITQPQLATYDNAPYFTSNSGCNGIKFRASVDGAQTTNTTYPRSELREMTNNGAALASWPSTSGTHTMEFEASIDHLPNTKPQIIVGQIHDADSDAISFRINGTSLYVTDHNNTTYQLVDSNFTSGKHFTGKFVAHDGVIDAYYNGVKKATVTAAFDTGYYKVGAYVQANCTNSSPCDPTNYGEVTVYSATVTHS